MQNESYKTPSKERAAICGLFCPACKSYVYTVENKLDELASFPLNKGVPVEDCACLGCRSDTLNIYCREHCFMKGCAEEKGIDFCGECAEYPCAELKKFQAARPHRIELWDSLERIRQSGYEQWYAEMLEHYACPKCQTINTAYDAKCRNCGESPSCGYVRVNGERIDEMLR